MYNRKQTNILPRISSKIGMTKDLHQSKNTFSRVNANIKQNEIISTLRLSKEKKPGTSINTKKPIYILPEIPIKKLAKTSDIKANNNNNNIHNNNDYYNREIDNPNNDKQNKQKLYYEKYENTAFILLENDEELKNMFNEVNEYCNIPDIRNWLDENLLKKEVFWAMLEFYIKKNLDVNRFIKKEIYKILKNKILDNNLAKSLKLIQNQYNEYINNIHNL